MPLTKSSRFKYFVALGFTLVSILSLASHSKAAERAQAGLQVLYDFEINLIPETHAIHSENCAFFGGSEFE